MLLNTVLLIGPRCPSLGLPHMGVQLTLLTCGLTEVARRGTPMVTSCPPTLNPYLISRQAEALAHLLRVTENYRSMNLLSTQHCLSWKKSWMLPVELIHLAICLRDFSHLHKTMRWIVFNQMQSDRVWICQEVDLLQLWESKAWDDGALPTCTTRSVTFSR